MKRVKHLPEQAAQCLGCACQNSENLAARELMLVTQSVSIRGVVAAIFMSGTAEHEEIVALAREAIREQREWCDRNGPINVSDCMRHVPVIAMPGGEGLLIATEDSDQ